MLNFYCLNNMRCVPDKLSRVLKWTTTLTRCSTHSHTRLHRSRWCDINRLNILFACSVVKQAQAGDEAPNLRTEDVIMCCTVKAVAHLWGGGVQQWWNSG